MGLNVPQSLTTIRLVQVAVHDTPELLASFVTSAVIWSVAPAPTVVEAMFVIVTETTGLTIVIVAGIEITGGPGLLPFSVAVAVAVIVTWPPFIGTRAGAA